MKKILFISDLVGLGGGETSLYNLMLQLKKRGNMVELLVPKRGKLVEAFEKQNIKVIIDNTMFLSKKNFFFFPFTIFKILIFLLKEQYYIVHSNSHKPCYTFGLISRVLKIKFYYTCHGQWFVFNTFKKLLFSAVCSKIITVSKNVHSNLLRQGFNPENLEQIYLGIEMEKFNCDFGQPLKKELNVGKGTLLVGMIARFQEIKGHDIFVKAVKIIIRDSDIKNVKFVIVGDNTFGNEKDQEYKNEIFKYVKKHNLNKHIYFLGERQDIPEILNSLDILVVPSRNESFGMVIVEALAAGCPVIASNCDGPSEIIKDGINGLLFEKENILHLKEVLETLIIDKNKRLELRRAGFQHVRKLYSIDKIAFKYESLYKGIE